MCYCGCQYESSTGWCKFRRCRFEEGEEKSYEDLEDLLYDRYQAGEITAGQAERALEYGY